MAKKPNAMLAQLEASIEAKYNALFDRRMEMLMQMGQDAAVMAANDVLQLGPGRAHEFCKAYTRYMNEMAALVCEDQKADNEFVYAKSKIDGRIRAVVGEDNFIPWERRYYDA